MSITLNDAAKRTARNAGFTLIELLAVMLIIGILMTLVVGVVNLAGLIPASPGQLGVYEFFASTVVIAVGIGEVQALAYAT